MVGLILFLMLSCSWAFGYAMCHPDVSMIYPILYTMAVVLGMFSPAIYNFIAIRRK